MTWEWDRPHSISEMLDRIAIEERQHAQLGNFSPGRREQWRCTRCHAWIPAYDAFCFGCKQQVKRR